MKKLVIWHCNDIHASFRSFCGLAGYVRTHRGPGDLFLDGGDFCDWRSPMVNGTHGVGGIKLLQAAGVDAMAVGNNEFLSGVDNLTRMSEQGLPVLSANLTNLQGGRIGQVKPSILLQRNGLRLLLIGCSPYWINGPLEFMNHAGVHTAVPFDSIQDEISTHAGMYDLCILLSHAGLYRDRQIAEQVKGIDVIIGGHTHTFMSLPLQIGSTWIHQSGCYGQMLGKTTLELTDDLRVRSCLSVNLPNSFPPDPVCEQVLQEQNELGRWNLSEKLYTIGRVLDFDAFQECPAVNAVCDSMLAEAPDCDLALINNGILSGPIGPVISRIHLLETSPSGLMPTEVVWLGRQIQQAYEASQNSAFIHQSGKGAGYRGTVLGTLSFSHNVRIHADTHQLEISGQPLQMDREYRVVSDDYLQRGTGYGMLGASRKDTEFHRGYIRECLERQLQHPEILAQAEERRTQ